MNFNDKHCSSLFAILSVRRRINLSGFKVSVFTIVIKNVLHSCFVIFWLSQCLNSLELRPIFKTPNIDRGPSAVVAHCVLHYQTRENICSIFGDKSTLGIWQIRKSLRAAFLPKNLQFYK